MTSAIQTFEAQQAGKERIVKALTGLAIARQAHDFGDAAQRVYVTLLSDLDWSLVTRACDYFARQARADYQSTMPSAGDLREQCELLLRQDAANQSRQRALPPPTSDERTYRCFQCRDDAAGWIFLRCPETACGRTRAHGAHTFTVRCPHWLRQHEAAIRNSARKAIEKNLPARPEFDMLIDLGHGRYPYERAVTL